MADELINKACDDALARGHDVVYVENVKRLLSLCSAEERACVADLLDGDDDGIAVTLEDLG